MRKKYFFMLTGLIICIMVLMITYISLFIGGEMEKTHLKILKPEDLTKGQLESFKNKTILFGHQSVGGNIVKGLKEISDSFNIIESEKSISLKKPYFLHLRVIKNGDPYSKTDHFIKLVEQNNKVEIALLKLCYADITDNTDIDKVFEYYKKRMNELKSKYPNIKIIHSTIPLYRNTGGIKAKIKHFFKLDKNIKRNKFNELMREEYNKKVLFDLALFESTYPDGKREKVGNRNYSLAKIYTDDGGHLNKKGREIVTSNFINFIAGL